ncbi:MAG: sugar phosphate isomerase/epimerase [Oscillospiraceae bacterium]|nr:sugar phosphate isomerase/epimerase [Oscillospiraceae bacterium]
MIKLGVNTVLFSGYSLREAAKAIKAAGFDGMELSAIKDMCEHLPVEEWKAVKGEIKAIAEQYQLELLAMEVASQDRDRLLKAFEAGAEIGIPVINIGPGGKSDVEEDVVKSIETIAARAEDAAQFGVTLCCKAHVNAAIYNTPTTLRMMGAIPNASFGIDMDPSHIWRAGEKPEEALPAVISRVKHIHIRDCKGEGPSPGEPAMQACGRGDIDLYGYFKAMVDAGYDGPVDLEVIGREQDMLHAAVIAAESCGYMKACLKKLGAR